MNMMSDKYCNSNERLNKQKDEEKKTHEEAEDYDEYNDRLYRSGG